MPTRRSGLGCSNYQVAEAPMNVSKMMVAKTVTEILRVPNSAGSSFPSCLSPSAHKIKGRTEDEHDDAVDGHDLVRGISYVVGIRIHSDQVPRKEGYPNNAYNHSTSLHTNSSRIFLRIAADAVTRDHFTLSESARAGLLEPFAERSNANVRSATYRHVFREPRCRGLRFLLFALPFRLQECI